MNMKFFMLMTVGLFSALTSYATAKPVKLQFNCSQPRCLLPTSTQNSDDCSATLSATFQAVGNYKKTGEDVGHPEVKFWLQRKGQASVDFRFEGNGTDSFSVSKKGKGSESISVLREDSKTLSASYELMSQLGPEFSLMLVPVEGRPGVFQADISFTTGEKNGSRWVRFLQCESSSF